MFSGQMAFHGDADASEPEIALYRPILVCAALLVVTGAIFYAVPTLDLTVSQWFFSAQTGFSLGKTTAVVVMRDLGIWITEATIAALIGLAIWWRVRPAAMQRWPSATPRADWLFIAAGMALGPGLLVNLIFKPVWGRARPIHIIAFGGHDQFSPAWAFSNQCHWACSFVSGEAAASALVVAFAVIAPPRWRLAMLVAAVLLTLVVSFARLAAGGHFLSDVVTAWLLTVLLILILRAQIYHGVLLGPFRRWWVV